MNNENPNKRIEENTEHTNTAWVSGDSVANSSNTIQLLTEVYNNALMAKESTETLLKYITDMDLADACRSQIIKYDEFCRNAQIMANKLNHTIPDKNKGARVMAKMNMKLKLTGDNCTPAIAEMVILGTTNGVIELGKLIRHTNEVDEKAEALAKQLLAYEEDKIDLMKFYL